MTRSEFEARTSDRIAVLSAVEYRARRAKQLGLRLRGLVLTEAEAEALHLDTGQRCWIEGRLLPIDKIIPFRLRLE